MEDYRQKTSLLTWLLGGLSAVLLAGGIYYWNANQTLTIQHDRAERRADSLLSVRLQLETDFGKLNGRLNEQLALTSADNAQLNKRLEDANRRLAQTSENGRELRRGAAGREQIMRQQNQSLTRLAVVRDSLTNQMNAMRGKLGWLTDSSRVYQQRNEQLGRELAQLNTTLATMVPRSALTGDGSRVEAVKPNDKVTAKAKKVDALVISLNVPAELRLEGTREVYLSLTDERQQAMMIPLRTATVTLPDADDVVPVHAVQTVRFTKSPQRIAFRVEPTADVKPGTYRAAVYTKDTYLGTVEFQLRDSFWFFQFWP